MKKIILLITLTVVSIYCKAQLVYTSDYVKIAMPYGVYKLTKQQVEAVPQYKDAGHPGQTYAAPYLYQLDNMSIGLFNANTDAFNNDLPKIKESQDRSYSFLKKHGNNTYRSNSKSIGNNHVVITNFSLNGKGHYWYYYQNQSKTLTQAGVIDYNIEDEAKAITLLDDVLNNIQFTK